VIGVKRREFITLLGGAAAWPLAARAQQSERMQRIGVLMGAAADDPRVKAQLAGLREGLARLGWVEGRTLQTDYRFAAGNPDRLSVLAKDLIALHPEVIFAQSTPGAAALQRETRTIAIVFVEVSDPVGSGFIASLARPGSNLTGTIQYEPGITGKWLAMLKEIAPSLAARPAIGHREPVGRLAATRSSCAAWRTRSAPRSTTSSTTIFAMSRWSPASAARPT
jgi:putative tryptophan/tyrosine transport system substrate-binding protein